MRGGAADRRAGRQTGGQADRPQQLPAAGRCSPRGAGLPQTSFAGTQACGCCCALVVGADGLAQRLLPPLREREPLTLAAAAAAASSAGSAAALVPLLHCRRICRRLLLIALKQRVQVVFLLLVLSGRSAQPPSARLAHRTAAGGGGGGAGGGGWQWGCWLCQVRLCGRAHSSDEIGRMSLAASAQLGDRAGWLGPQGAQCQLISPQASVRL